MTGVGKLIKGSALKKLIDMFFTMLSKHFIMMEVNLPVHSQCYITGEWELLGTGISSAVFHIVVVKALYKDCKYLA